MLLASQSSDVAEGEHHIESCPRVVRLGIGQRFTYVEGTLEELTAGDEIASPCFDPTEPLQREGEVSLSPRAVRSSAGDSLLYLEGAQEKLTSSNEVAGFHLELAELPQCSGETTLRS